jgi:hypothetical protein
MLKLANREIHRNAKYTSAALPQPITRESPVDSIQISLNV